MSVSKLDFDSVRQAKKSFTSNLNEVIQNIPDGFVLGLYIYLTSLPPEWNVNSSHLMSHFNVGRDKLARAMSWLSDHFLITHLQERKQDGSFGKCTIVVEEGWTFIEQFVKNQKHDTALLKTRNTDNPDTGKSAPIYNTNTTKQKALKNKTKSSCASRPKIKSEKPKNDAPLPEGHFLKPLESKRENPVRHKFADSMDRQASVRSTVPFFGPGHPAWEAQQQWKRDMESEKVAQN
jgi:hypothetical protein